MGFECTLPLERWTLDKVEALGVAWASWLDFKYPDSSWASLLGLVENHEHGDVVNTEEVEVNLKASEPLKRASDDVPEPIIAPKFQ